MKTYADIPEHEKQQLREVGFSEEDIGICILLKNGCPGGDIIQIDLPRREGEDDESYDARYIAALENGEFLCPDSNHLSPLYHQPLTCKGAACRALPSSSPKLRKTSCKILCAPCTL